MAKFNTRPARFKSSGIVVESWSSFRKGLNLLLRSTELSNEELAKADNIMLVGKGVPTGRWGTLTYFSAGATGSVRNFATYKNNSGSTNEILALTDSGYLAKKNGTSYTVITGQSWPSGSYIHSEQLGGKTYLTSPDRTFTEYNGTSLVVYSQIAAPTGVSATNFSGASGPASVSYEVVAIGANGGQTTPSTNYVLANLPSTQAATTVHLFWSAPSAATLSGYEIYRGRNGDESLLASVGPETTKYVDTGTAASQTILAPLTNTTGGVNSKFIKKYKDRLLVVDVNDPNKLMISGRYPDHTKFSWLDGGGYIYVDPDSGDNITAIEVQPIADKIIVYKERASYLIDLNVISIGNFAVLDPQYTAISTSVGCSNQDTLATVENDTFYFGRDGLYVTGYEPNFLNIIRTNEISARIRPYLALLNDTDYSTACAFYVNKKYVLSFPERREMMVYDRERGAWTGPWKLPYGVRYMKKYIDGTGTERWVLGSYVSPQAYTFDAATNTDNGTALVKTLRTKKTYFGDWTRLNIEQFFHVLFRNVRGTITVNVIAEDRTGVTSVIKTFDITGSETGGLTGWGMSQWGLTKWGLSSGSTAVISSEEITRWTVLFKQIRLMQIEIVASGENANFEFLEAKAQSAKMGVGSLSTSQRV